MVDVLHSVSRIVFSAHSTRCWAEFRPLMITSEAGRAGFEPANRLTVLTMYSTTAVERVPVCINGPTRVWPENSGEPLLGRYITQRRHAPVGLAPTSPDPMYSEPAVGLCSMGDEVFGQSIALSFELRPAQVLRKSGRLESNQQPMYSDAAVAFFVSHKGPTRFLPRRSFPHVVPAGSWACIKTLQRGKRFRRGHLNRM